MTLSIAMHDAFEPVPILEKLPLQIDCLAAWGEPRVLGSRSGLLESGLDLSQGWRSGPASGCMDPGQMISESGPGRGTR